MKKYRLFVGLLAVASLALLPAATCTPEQTKEAKDVAKDVFTLAQTLCIVAHAFDPPDAVKTACNVTDELTPAMNALVAQHKQGAVAYARSQLTAQHCLMSDAGL